MGRIMFDEARQLKVDNEDYDIWINRKSAALKVNAALLREGDDIAERVQANRRFQLEEENFCKKIWKPWFEKGDWNLIDLTQPHTAMLQVDELVVTEQQKIKLKSIIGKIFSSVECDGVMYRWGMMIPFDYKFIEKALYGIGVKQKNYADAYNHYYECSVPFAFLIWDNLNKMRWILTVNQDPDAYEFATWGGDLYLDVTDDIKAARMIPFKMPKPISVIEQLTAMHLAQYPSWNGKITKEELASVKFNVEEKELKHLFQTIIARRNVQAPYEAMRLMVERDKKKKKRKRKRKAT